MFTVTKIIVAGLLAAVNMHGGTGDPLKVKPIQTMSGGDTKFNMPLVRLIQAQSVWQELWTMHKGAALVEADSDKAPAPIIKAPEVDFEKNQVLVVFGGKMPNVQAYEYVKTYAKDSVAVIQLSQSMVPPSADRPVFHPYVMLVIPKEGVPIDVELDSIAKDGSHFWMRIAGFSAPKEKKTGT